MKIGSTVLYSLLLGFIFTLVSIPLSLSTTREVVGNLCGPTAEEPMGLCYEDLPQTGFPLVFLKDSAATSGIGSLGPEDHVYLGAFLINWLVFTAVAAIILLVISRLQKRS